MKFPISFVIFLACFHYSFAQTSFLQPIDGTDCSNQFFKALLDEDAEAVANLVSSDFAAVGFQGQGLNAPLLRQALSDGTIKVDSGMLAGTNTRTYGNVAVVTGIWNVSARIQNANFQGELAYMTICVSSGGKWRVVAVQFTPIR